MRLDAFGNHLRAGFAGIEHQGADQRTAGRVSVDIAGQAHVQLHDVRLQLNDMAQRGIAGPRIVNAQFQAAAAQRFQCLQQQFIIIDPRMLGNFQQDPVQRLVVEQVGKGGCHDRVRRCVHGQVLIGSQVRQFGQRLCQRGNFQRFRQPGFGRLIEPDIRRALWLVGEAAQRFITNRRHLPEIKDRLVHHREGPAREHVFNSAALVRPLPAIGQLGVDLPRRQFGKHTHRIKVAHVQCRVRLAAEAAEHAIGAAILQADRNAHVRPNRNRLRDRHGDGDWLVGRVRDQFRQPAFQDMLAIDIIQAVTVANLGQRFQARRIDASEHRPSVNEFRQVSDVHVEMLAHG